MKKLVLLAIVLFFSAVFVTPAQAQSLGITSIGGVSVTGTLSTWNHQGYNPLIVGTASPSAQVLLDVNAVDQLVTADSAGVWRFQPSNISSAGNYAVSIASGSQSVIFTLAITAPTTSQSTSSATATATSSATSTATNAAGVVLPASLPSSGSNSASLLLVGGIFSIVTGVYFGAYALGYFSRY